MTLQKYLEIGMLFCFGFAWPFNIVKSYNARSNQGKSLLFLVVIWIGYLFGIFNKALSPVADFVLWLYIINIIMVSVDIALFYRNRAFDKNKELSSGS